jgi:plastocyanin
MRARVTVLVVIAVAAVIVPSVTARGGGGGFCAGSLPFTDESANVVEMEDNCFAPTVARVGRGETVTFVNRDLQLHTVGGANGVFGDLRGVVRPGDEVSFTFNEEGVFPYVCIFHPGMAGAIVVGDGAGRVSSAAGIAPASLDDQSKSKETSPTSASSDEGIPLALVVSVAAVLVLAAGALIRFRTRPTPAPVQGAATPRR